MESGEWTIREEKKTVKGHIDIPEFSFGELDDLQVCLSYPFECCRWPCVVRTILMEVEPKFNWMMLYNAVSCCSSIKYWAD